MALPKKEVKYTPRKYDRSLIILEMMDWVKKEDSINFASFCFDYGYQPSLIWRLDREDDEFHDAYTLAKLKLAERRERQLNAEMMHYSAYMRYQRSYDAFLARSEEEEKDREAIRRQNLTKAEQQNLVLLAKMAGEGKLAQKD